MDTEPRERLDRIITSIENYNSENLNSLYDLFYSLTEFNMNENKDLWEKLRAALKSNKFFKDNEEYIAKNIHLKKGRHFWYDPENW